VGAARGRRRAGRFVTDLSYDSSRTAGIWDAGLGPPHEAGNELRRGRVWGWIQCRPSGLLACWDGFGYDRRTHERSEVRNRRGLRPAAGLGADARGDPRPSPERATHGGVRQWPPTTTLHGGVPGHREKNTTHRGQHRSGRTGLTSCFTNQERWTGSAESLATAGAVRTVPPSGSAPFVHRGRGRSRCFGRPGTGEAIGCTRIFGGGGRRPRYVTVSAAGRLCQHRRRGVAHHAPGDCHPRAAFLFCGCQENHHLGCPRAPPYCKMQFRWTVGAPLRSARSQTEFRGPGAVRQ